MSIRAGAHYSLRRRLMTAMSIGFALLLVIISIFLIGFTRNAANKSYDLLLAGAALSILEKVSYADEEIAIDLPHSALDILSLAPQDRVFYSLTTEDGTLLTGDPKLAEITDSEKSAAPSFSDQQFLDSPRPRGKAKPKHHHAKRAQMGHHHHRPKPQLRATATPFPCLLPA